MPFPEVENIFDEAEEEGLQEARPISVTPDLVPPELTEDTIPDNIALSGQQRREIDREVASVVSAGMARDYTARKEEKDGVEELYQRVKNQGHTRQEVNENFDNIHQRTEQDSVQKTFSYLNQARDPAMVDEVNKLVGNGTLKNSEEVSIASKIALILKSPIRGFQDLWENDDVEEFFEANADFDPLISNSLQKRARREASKRIAQKFQERRRFTDAIDKAWSEDTEGKQTFMSLIDKAWEKGDLTPSMVFSYLQHWASTGRSLSDLGRAAPSMAPSLAAGLLAPVITPYGSAATAFAAGGYVARDARIVERMEDMGVDMANPDSILAFFDDPEKVAKVRSDVNKYALAIAGAEAIGGGIGGKLTNTLARSTAKGKIKKAMLGLGVTGAEALEEATTEAGGEYVANIVAGTPEKNSASQFLENFIMGGALGGGVGGAKGAVNLLINNGEAITAKREQVAKELKEREAAKEAPKKEAPKTAEPPPAPPTQAIPETTGEPEVSEQFETGGELPAPIEEVPESDIIRSEQEVPSVIGEEPSPETAVEEEPVLPLQSVIETANESIENISAIAEFVGHLQMIQAHTMLGEERYLGNLRWKDKGLESINKILDAFREAPFVNEFDFDKNFATDVIYRTWWWRGADSRYTELKGDTDRKAIQEIFNDPMKAKDIALYDGGPTFEESVEDLIALNRNIKKAMKESAPIREKEVKHRERALKKEVKERAGEIQDKSIRKAMAETGIDDVLINWRRKALAPLQKITGIKDFGTFISKKTIGKLTQSAKRRGGVGAYDPQTGAILVGEKTRVTTMFHEVAHEITVAYVRAYQYLKKRPGRKSKEQKEFISRMEKFEDRMSEIGGVEFSMFTEGDIASVEGMTAWQKRQKELAADPDKSDYLMPQEVIAYMTELILINNPEVFDLPSGLFPLRGIHSRILAPLYRNYLETGSDLVIKEEVVDLFRLLFHMEQQQGDMEVPLMYSLGTPKDLPAKRLPTRLQVDKIKILENLKYEIIEIGEDGYYIKGKNAYGHEVVVSQNFTEFEFEELIELRKEGKVKKLEQEIQSMASEID